MDYYTERVTATELMMAVLEACYRSVSTVHHLRTVIAAIRRENPTRFMPSGKKWRLV